MACCSLVGEAAAALAEMENMDDTKVAAELERAFEENPRASDGEKHPANRNGEDNLNEGVLDDEKWPLFYFGSSTIIIGKIKEVEGKGYFPEAKLTPGVETVPEPNADDAMVYKDFYVAGLCMPPHPALSDILLHFQAQLHQLTPNAIT
jgi:hypothetical protein